MAIRSLEMQRHFRTITSIVGFEDSMTAAGQSPLAGGLVDEQESLICNQNGVLPKLLCALLAKSWASTLCSALAFALWGKNTCPVYSSNIQPRVEAEHVRAPPVFPW
jgi:hypothetical protein